MTTPALQPTAEQRAIVEADTRRDLVVNALAGAAKTTTLEWRARARPDRRILYIAFSKEVELEASRRFPRNVTCKTTHALAYAQFGVPFRAANNLGEPTPEQLRKVFPPKLMDERDPALLALALATVRAYMASADDTIERKHVPVVTASEHGVRVDYVLETAHAAWEIMANPDDGRIRAPHDLYLKLWQLSRPTLHDRYDEVFLDEAQDSNAAVFRVLRDQDWVHRVLVGDSRQAIYGFRGAADVLQALPNAERHSLTGSFRFGPELAEVANTVLAHYLGSDLFVRGLGPPTAILAPHDPLPKSATPPCFLHRTNAGLLDQALALVREYPRQYWLGGLERYGLDTIEDVYRVYMGKSEQARHPALRALSDLGAVQRYAQVNGNRELELNVDVVFKYRHSTLEHLRVLRAAACKDPRQADVILATAHRAKGKEFDVVVLGEDFVPLMYFEQTTGIWSPRLLGWLPERLEEFLVTKEEDARLLYVALTRARKCLRLNADLNALLLWAAGKLKTGVEMVS